MKKAMKNRCFPMLVLALCPLLATAAPVGKETARRAAAAFLANNGVRSNTLTDLTETAGFAHLYIFNGDAGFVVMPTDDCVQPILGYSLTGTFVADAMPDNVRWWLQGYDDQIADAVAQQSRATATVAQQWEALRTARPAAAKTDVVVGPLVTTKWGQGSPFNMHCPSGCVTGCVATAMAQIMNYHQHPAIGMGSHTYTWNGQTNAAHFGADYYDWNAMTDTYDGNSTDAEKQAVATLMYHCGVSVEMKYASDASGSNNRRASFAFNTFFNYDGEYHKKSAINNDSLWTAMLVADLDQQRLVLYGGKGSLGGHSFVCDGYDSDGKFHFNFGWYGGSDGFYVLSANNFPNSQDAVFHIAPKTCDASAPMGLVCTEPDGCQVALSWGSAEGATAYAVYRNNVMIAQTAQPNYADTAAEWGENVYFVRSVDASGGFSVPSNAVTTTVTDTPQLVVDELLVSCANNTAMFSWSMPWWYPQGSTDALSYVEKVRPDDDAYVGWGQSEDLHLYWGVRYPAALLSDHMGKAVSKVSFYVYQSGTYQVLVYLGSDEDHLEAPLSEKTITTVDNGWVDVKLDVPVAVDGSQDLWVFVHDVDGVVREIYSIDTDTPHGQYWGGYHGDTPRYPHEAMAVLSTSQFQSDWFLMAYLTDDYFTFNLYRDDERIAEGLYAPTYHDTEIPVGTHAYYVKTYANGGESDASNTVNVASMATGWNWFAPMVATTMDDLEAAIGTANLEATLPSTIDDPIAPGAMVKVKTRQACAFVTEAPSSATVTIGPGLNWFGFTGSNGTPIADVFDTPAEGDKIMAQDEGFAVFEGGTWKGTLTTLRRGLGYIYFSPSRVR